MSPEPRKLFKKTPKNLLVSSKVRRASAHRPDLKNISYAHLTLGMMGMKKVPWQRKYQRRVH